jgi:Transposase DDE domain
MFQRNHLSPISKVNHEDTTLLPILKEHFGSSMNLARIKLMSLFITALCKVQTVNFDRLACDFNTTSQKESSLRRIQRFFAHYCFDQTSVAKVIFKLIPKGDKVGLSLDRTNWKFGETNINILVLGVVYKGVAFPLLFSMMPKFGNSNTKERIDLLNRYNELFGFDTIDFLVADREFIGHNWLDYLNRNRIQYHIRIRENFKVTLLKNGRKVNAQWLFNRLKMGQFDHYPKIVLINNVQCYISASLIKSKTGQPEYQFLISFNQPEKSITCYKDRWQIETMFKALKSSGFNIEKTHLNDLQRIEKLLSLVFMAFVWCYLVGIHVDQNIRPIKIKKHGFRAKSLFKYGLDFIANTLLNPQNQSDVNIFEFLSCT